MTLRQPASSLLRWLALCGALACSACGTTLLVSDVTFDQDVLVQLRRGGAALGCHERTSPLFPVFLICPGRDRALGVAAEQQQVALSCPDLSQRACRKLFLELRGAGRGQPHAPARRGEER